MITYDKLWQTMEAKKMTQGKLISYYHISRGQIDRLRKNQGVTTHTIDMLCNILDCNVEDIMEHVKDDPVCSDS